MLLRYATGTAPVPVEQLEDAVLHPAVGVFLDDHNLLAAEETPQRIYETISDKPGKMVRYENAPRPDDA